MTGISETHTIAEFTHNPSELIHRLKLSRLPFALTIDGQPEVVIQNAVAYQQLLERVESAENIQSDIEGHKNGEACSETELEREKLRAQILAQGHKHYGIFADDPGAMEVFDEIERSRDQFTLADLDAEIRP